MMSYLLTLLNVNATRTLKSTYLGTTSDADSVYVSARLYEGRMDLSVFMLFCVSGATSSRGMELSRWFRIAVCNLRPACANPSIAVAVSCVYTDRTMCQLLPTKCNDLSRGDATWISFMRQTHNAVGVISVWGRGQGSGWPMDGTVY